jgi:hypothetical protein
MLFATLLAETSRRRVAAFKPDRAIVEMLLMGARRTVIEPPLNTHGHKQGLRSAAGFER